MAEKISQVEHVVFVSASRSVAVIFKELIGDHPVAPQLAEQIEKCWVGFCELYVRAIDLYHQALIDAPGNPPGYIPQRPRMWAFPSKAIDIPQEGDEKVEINNSHYFEIMDRASCLCVIFHSLIEVHSVASVLTKEVEVLGDQLAELYQHAARLDRDRNADE